jgi:predicted MPP superfamily phosphohydrolase
MSLGRAEVTQHTVPLAGLPPRLDGLRIVHLSDLHVGPFFGQAAVRQAVAAVRACQPDVVALTGDFVNFRSMRHLASAAGELAALQAPLGVFGVLGNHDYWEGAAEVRRVLEGSGVRVLVNEHLPLSDGLWLAGIDDLMSGSPDVEGRLGWYPGRAAPWCSCRTTRRSLRGSAGEPASSWPGILTAASSLCRSWALAGRWPYRA